MLVECELQVKLAEAVAGAVEALNLAKAEFARAKKKNEDLGPATIALGEARRREIQAVATLNLHLLKHGC